MSTSNRKPRYQDQAEYSIGQNTFSVNFSLSGDETPNWSIVDHTHDHKESATLDDPFAKLPDTDTPPPPKPPPRKEVWPPLNKYDPYSGRLRERGIGEKKWR